MKTIEKRSEKCVTAREIIRKTNNNSDSPLTFRRADGSKKKQEKKFFVLPNNINIKLKIKLNQNASILIIQSAMNQ